MPFPMTHRPAIDRALTGAFGTTSLEAAAPLSGGLSAAQVYKIRVGGIDYLLRVEGARDLFRDPGRWYGCMRTAAAAFLAPRVRHADPVDGVAIMDFIPEQSLSLDYVGDRTAMVTELAQAVRALHATPPFPPLMDYLDAMEGLIGQMRATGFTPAQTLSEPLALYGKVAQAYRGLPVDLVSSHNDLNPRNILYDGARLWLIDWESAFLADRWVDLATLANFYTSNPGEEETLLRVYFGQAPDDAQRARLYLARQINHIFYAVMFLSGAAAERPGTVLPSVQAPALAALHQALGQGDDVLGSWEGRAAYGLARLNAAARNIADPACATALTILGL